MLSLATRSRQLVGTSMKLSDIFKEGSEARKRFAQFYAVFAIAGILTVLLLLALATRA